MPARPQSVGYAALVVAPALLLARAFDLAPSAAGLDVLLIAIVALLAVSIAVRELTHVRDGETLALDRSDALSALAVVVGAVATQLLAVAAGLGPVVASALVGLVAGFVAPRVDSAAYCGSFVGMASAAALPLGWVVAAGAVAGGVFVAARGVFDGFGGKLGTTAFAGCLVAVGLGGGSPLPAAGLSWAAAALVVFVGAVAALLTALLGIRYDAGAVVGSAAVGLLAGLALPPVFGPESALPAVAFCASFAGMAAPDRLGGWAAYAAAGAVAGALFVVVSPAFAGMGGKLGTTAFLACLVVAGARRLAPTAWVERARIPVSGS